MNFFFYKDGKKSDDMKGGFCKHLQTERMIRNLQVFLLMCFHLQTFTPKACANVEFLNNIMKRYWNLIEFN